MLWKRERPATAERSDVIDDPVVRRVLEDAGDGVQDLQPRFTPFGRGPEPEILRAITAARSIA